MPSFEQTLNEMLRAGYSGLVVHSQEALRVEQAAMAAASKAGRGFRRWTVTEGWKKSITDKPDGDPVTGEAAAVNAIKPAGGREDAKDNKTLYLMHVYEEFFNPPEARQALRDVVGPFRELKRTILLVGNCPLPKDIEKEFTLVDFAFPTREEIQDIAVSLCESQKDNGVAVPQNGELAKVVDSALGLTATEAQNAFALSIVRHKRLEAKVTNEEKKKIVKASGLLEFIDVTETMADIGGLENMKGYLEGSKRLFSKRAAEFGLRPPRGIIVTGVQGCGKSLTAKATASCFELPLVRLDFGRLYGSLLGQSEGNLREMEKVIESIAPVVLWADEVEKSLGDRGGGDLDGGASGRMFGAFLTWLQERPDGIFFFATANDASILKPEFLRRFDQIFGVDLPNRTERIEIAKIHIRKAGERAKIDVVRDARIALAKDERALGMIADATEKFTGSEIEQAVIEGVKAAFNDGERNVQEQDIVAAAEKMRPLSKTAPERIKAIQEWVQGRAVWASKPDTEAPTTASGRALEVV